MESGSHDKCRKESAGTICAHCYVSVSCNGHRGVVFFGEEERRQKGDIVLWHGARCVICLS
jgi:hypothetical protein